MYDTLHKAEQVYRTARAYQIEGRVDDAHRLIEDNKTLLSQRKMLDTARGTVSRLRKQMDAVKRDPTLSAQDKRVRLDRLDTLVSGDRKSGEEGKRWSVQVDTVGGRKLNQKQKRKK